MVADDSLSPEDGPSPSSEGDGKSDETEEAREAGAADGGRRPVLDLRAALRVLSAWVRGLPRPVRLGGLAALVVVVVGAWLFMRWVGGGSGPERLVPGEVVSDFFHAQRAGDCERLVELVTEESWSDGGNRSREEFLDQCAEVVEGYEPVVDRIDFEVVDREGSSDPDGDSVEVSIIGDTGIGTLVQEDGEWKVETDDVILRVGPSAAETVRGYVETYEEGDCERLMGYLTEDAWSADGQLSRDEFLEGCSAAASARQGAAQPVTARIAGLEVSLEADDRATAVVSLVSVDGSTIRGIYDRSDNLVLVKEGLGWRLDRTEDLSPGAPPGTLLNGLRYLELEAQVVDEIRVDGGRCFTYLDDPFPSPSPPSSSSELVTPLRVVRDFSSPCHTTVSLYEVADEAAARDLAEQMVEELKGQETRQPYEEADVPGVPAATGVRTGCDHDPCLWADAFLPHGRVVIAVNLEVGGLNDAAEILRAQRERL